MPRHLRKKLRIFLGMMRMGRRSVNQKDCRGGCGKEIMRVGYIKWENKNEIINCEECGRMLQGKEINVYHKKTYCKECMKAVKRRGA